MKKIVISVALLLSAIVVGIGVVRLVSPEAPTAMRETEREDAELEAPRARQIDEVEPSYPDEASREGESEGAASVEESTPTLSETLGDSFFSNLERIRDLEEPLGETGVAAFKAMFDALDADEKDSYAHHAANLVPDENIACLKAILMDALEPQEVLETIYYDLLNRPEEVKTPILREVAEVENHPLREEVRELISNQE